MPTEDELKRTAQQMKFIQEHVVERDEYDILNVKVCIALLKNLKRKFESISVKANEPYDLKLFDDIMKRLECHVEFLENIPELEGLTPKKIGRAELGEKHEQNIP